MCQQNRQNENRYMGTLMPGQEAVRPDLVSQAKRTDIYTSPQTPCPRSSFLHPPLSQFPPLTPYCASMNCSNNLVNPSLLILHASHWASHSPWILPIPSGSLLNSHGTPHSFLMVLTYTDWSHWLSLLAFLLICDLLEAKTMSYLPLSSSFP
jgi:hypothetical protein